MPLRSLLNPIPKKASDRNWWSLQHKDDHDAIIAGVLQKFGVNLKNYIIDPINPKDFDGWLLRHQQMHDDMNNATNTPATDLSLTDFENDEERQRWALLHFREHQQNRQVLGI